MNQILQKYFALLVLLAFNWSCSAQTFLNGDFENTTAVGNIINMTNSFFGFQMPDDFAFGTYNGGGPAGGDMDIITTAIYCGLAQSGNWYIAFTGGGTDQVALKLSIPLVTGQTYTFSFYDRYCPTIAPTGDFEIGLSTTNNTFGTLIYSAPTPQTTWTQRTVTFVAPNNGQYITVRTNGLLSNWAHADNFAFDSCIPLDIDLGNDTTICTGANLVLDATKPSATYLWQDNSTNPTYNVTTAGTYFVEVTDSCGTVYDTINVSTLAPFTIDLGNDTTLCTGDNLLLDVTTPNATYLWQDNSTNATFNVTNVGTYYVEVTNICGTAVDTIIVLYDLLPTVNLGNDTTLCVGSTLLLDVTFPASTYLWQDNSTNTTFNVVAAGTYSVDVTNLCGTVSDDIVISYTSAPTVDFGNDTILCPGIVLLLDATIPNGIYLWQDNSTNATFNVTTAGTYIVGAMSSCGADSDTIDIAYDVLPIVDLGNDTTLCTGATILLDATFSSSTYLWQDNSTNATFDVVSAGTYSVDVSNYCGTVSDDINVLYQTSPIINLGNDTTLCSGSVLILDATAPNATYQWQDNSTNGTFTAAQSGLYIVTVTNTCGSFTDSIDIQFNAAFDIDLGNDTTVCTGTVLTLSTNVPNTTTVWQDQSVGSTFNVTVGGTYYATTSLGGCIAQDTIQITMTDPPYVDLGNDIAVCEDEWLVLAPINPQAGSYLWSTGSTEQMIIVDEFDDYIVSVTNSCGTAFDTISVIDMECNCTFYLPNTITPDGDEFNQGLKVVYDCEFYEFEFTMYNRWGQKIFTSYDPDGAWDATYLGKKVQSGTYSWVLRYKKDFNAAEATEVTGHINVLY